MEKTFDLKQYVGCLGDELVHEFNKAKMSTQSVAVGSNKESSVIKKLEDILPSGVGIGSDFVFDSYGNVSNQCDIILYEKDYVIKATINGNIKDTYYNCESVIAVGEVKSLLNKTALSDCLNKFTNLNKLQRYINPKELNTDRQYLSKMALIESIDNRPLPRTSFDRIYKFILCEEIILSFEQIGDMVNELIDNRDSMFNALVDIKGKYISHFNEKKERIASPFLTNGLYINECKISGQSFLKLLQGLVNFINVGTTVPLNYNVYLHDESIYKNTTTYTFKNNNLKH